MGKLAQNVEDILTEIKVHIEPTEQNSENIQPVTERNWKSQDLDEFAIEICQTLEKDSLHIDYLAEQLEVKTSKLMPKLLELEMEGCIRQTAGKNFELV